MRNDALRTTTPLHYKDATELARLIRTKSVSPVEVVSACLDQVSRVNTKINAVVTLLADQALAAARDAEAAVLRGETLGVLHGVPFSIKDVIDVAGVATQRGSKLFVNYIANTEATTVRRMKAAGAIPLIKSNVPEFSAWWETDNLITGRTNNPWNLERTPGGSSGGESAAIAAGMSPIGLGSDVAISVRGPAACTGIVGLKATHGRIPYTGHFPSSLSRYWHIGPMARSVRDIATAFSLLNGPDGSDPYAVHAVTAEAALGSLPGQPLRIGWMAEEGFGPVDREVVAAVATAATLLHECGCQIEQVRLPILEQNDFVAPAMTLFMGTLLPQLRPIMAGREADLHAIGKMYAVMSDPALADYVEAEMKVEQLKAVFASYFQHYDVLLCPVIPCTAPLHALQEYVINGTVVSANHIMRATVPFNLTGLPALSVPFCLSSEHLPINVQLVSQWCDEATILRLGALLEATRPEPTLHPPL